MTKASMAANRKTTIDPNEAAHFGALAADWWDPKGSSAMLHKLNPVRLGFVRRQIDLHFGCDETAMKPLSGKSALDVGCGAGLLCEPLARLGASVTGVDAAAENIAAAKAHAVQSGLDIRYWAGELQHLPVAGRTRSAASPERPAKVSILSGDPSGRVLPLKKEVFDLVTSMEVIEHVADPAAFVAELAARLKPDGLLILSTPNRTVASKLFLVEAAERLGQVPRGTHDWDKFLTHSHRPQGR
jgi:2-polyprenyl-6-hydroxyphenyl methylase/3-demethylubiquinone-9 3-methyltransferase